MIPVGTSRRSVIKGVGLGAATATLAARVAPALAAASSAGHPGGASAGRIWSGEYWAKKGEVSLYMFRKRLDVPRAGEQPRPVLFLVHGSSLSSRPVFDLSVPGHGEYSLMNVFARYGYDVWTMDHEGYGRSSRTSGNSNIASGVEDLKAAMEVIHRETGQARPHFFGESSGALRAAAFAGARPENTGRMVLAALTYTGKGSPTLSKRAEQVEFYRTHNRRPRGRKMIESIFTRDKPGTSEQAVAVALADAEMQFGDTVPTGTYLDMTAHLPIVDPARIRSPVLVVRGEYDGIATEEDLLDFYRKLPNADRQFAILPGLAHSVVLGVNRQQFWHVMRSFLSMPPHVAV